MPGLINSTASPSICIRVSRIRSRKPCIPLLPNGIRYKSSSSDTPPQLLHDELNRSDGAAATKQPGAMSRRLQEMSDHSLETGGRSARKAVEEAGFSEDLKKQLEKKIADASFRSEHAAAFAQHAMPTAAGKGTRDIAAARPWAGTESVEDASFRMLNDAHKPLRTASKTPSIRGPPSRIDTGRPRGKVSTGSRLAMARERSAVYEQQQGMKEQQGLTDEEREKFRQQMKANFQPGARSVPASVQGLAALANQRIEDAIGRGQFKNLPDRGKKLERDHNANSPFINTTEYFLNKMIKKQEIVPPWIEKQQEVVSTLNTFRRRLRADWKRHVARSISSRGGSLESQLKLAEEYAYAESLANPASPKIEQLNIVNNTGHMSQITVSGEMKVTTSDDATILEEEIEVMEQTFNDDGSLKTPAEQVIVIAEQPLPSQPPPPALPRQAIVGPYRDPHWEATERSYHTLAIQHLNGLTRSYNLMAPDLAKKPYFSLERELKACYAEIAPQVAAAISERALAPKVRGVEVFGHKPGSVLEKFSLDKASQVYDERKPQYGFRQFWRDLFAPKL